MSFYIAHKNERPSVWKQRDAKVTELWFADTVDYEKTRNKCDCNRRIQWYLVGAGQHQSPVPLKMCLRSIYYRSGLTTWHQYHALRTNEQILTKLVSIVWAFDGLLLKEEKVWDFYTHAHDQTRHKQLTFHASSKSTGRITYLFFRTAVGRRAITRNAKLPKKLAWPWSPAACAMEDISAEDNRSGLDTSRWYIQRRD